MKRPSIHQHYVLDAERRPVPVEVTDPRFIECIADQEGRRVAETEIGEIWVSTIFLPVDHRHTDDGPPLLFETMIFGGPLDGRVWRYSSWDDATIGHEAAVRMVRAAIRGKQ